MKKVVLDNVYTNREGRKFIMYKDEYGKYHSESYARYLMEEHLGYELPPDKDVHHKDGDKTNDTLNNLEIIDSKQHKRTHALKYKDTFEVCAECGKVFLVTSKQHSEKQRNANRGHGKIDEYFCSRKCSGKHNQRVQMEHRKEKSSE